ncbi:MAG: hypothetical protein AAF363_11480 [Bacteroidota bacterium]
MQKSIFKTLFVLCVLFASPIFFISCSDDDEVEELGTLSNVDPVVFERAEDVTVPDAMQQSTDPNAQEVNVTVAALSGFTAFSSFFVAPQGVQPDRINNPIVGTNQRTANVLRSETYIFTSQGATVAFQISETADEFIFEYFFSLDGGNTYVLFYLAAQTKDGSSAFFELYDTDNGNIVFAYDFEVNPDDSVTVSFESFDSSGSVEESITGTFNPDDSGELEVFEGGNLIFEAEWDSVGNGSFTEFDSAGNIIDSGSWTVS